MFVELHLIQYNTIQYKICKAPCCRGWHWRTGQLRSIDGGEVLQQANGLQGHPRSFEMTRIDTQTKPIDLGSESAENWQLPSISTIAIVIITQLISCYSFYRPTKAGRLSRPRHCSKGAQPVPKAAYRSSCHDKRNRPRCNSNLSPLTPQSDALTTQTYNVYRRSMHMKTSYDDKHIKYNIT